MIFNMRLAAFTFFSPLLNQIAYHPPRYPIGEKRVAVVGHNLIEKCHQLGCVKDQMAGLLFALVAVDSTLIGGRIDREKSPGTPPRRSSA